MDRDGAARQARIRGSVPPQHRDSATCSPSEVRLSGADLTTIETLGRGAGAPGPGARALRDRRARIARQAQPRHAAAALSRVAGGPYAGAARRSAPCAADIAARWLPHIQRMLGDRRARRACGGDRRAGVDQPRGRAEPRAPVPRGPRSADPGDGGSGARRQRIGRGRRGRRSHARRRSLGDARRSARDARRDVAVAVRQIARSRGSGAC